MRRHVHGSTYVDERAILLEGPVPSGAGVYLDTFYYLLQELSTVTGLIKKNGTLAEAYVYDAYGQVAPWGYRNFDFNRDGDVDAGDGAYFATVLTSAGEPTTDPTADADMDGDSDSKDYATFLKGTTSAGEPPITLHVSAVGNPYFFTGRRLHMLETDPTTAVAEANTQVQYNRARHYDPEYGRWLRAGVSGVVGPLKLSFPPLLCVSGKARSNPGASISCATSGVRTSRRTGPRFPSRTRSRA